MENNKGQKIYKMIMLIIIVVILTSLISAFGTYQYLTKTGTLEGNQTTSSNLK